MFSATLVPTPLLGQGTEHAQEDLVRIRALGAEDEEAERVNATKEQARNADKERAEKAEPCGAETGPATPSSTHRARKRTVPGKKKLCKPVLVYQG